LLALFIDHKGTKILSWQNPDIDYRDLRKIEKEIVSPEGIDQRHTYYAVYDLRWDVKTQAILGIIQTIVVCLILATGAWFF